MKNKLPKLILIGSVPPPHHGVTVYVEKLLKSNINDAFYIKHLDISDHRDTTNFNKLDIKNIKIGISNIFSLVVELIRFKPDLVYCTPAPYIFPFFRESCFIFLTKIFSKAKIVAHIHAGEFFRINFYDKSNVLVKLLIKQTFRYCDCGIVLGKNLVKYYDLFFNQTVVLWNGIEISKNGNGSNYYNKKLDYNNINISFLSNLCENKGIITLIKALSQLSKEAKNKLRFQIAGDWLANEDETRKLFYQLIKDNDLSEKISILGGLYSSKKKNLFYQNCDIFIFPTNMDAFPLVILEAMLNGCAVISTYEGAIPELVIDGETGFLLEKNDHEKLAEKIFELINSPEKIVNFGNNGRNRIIKYFTLDHNVNGLKNIFNDLLHC